MQAILALEDGRIFRGTSFAPGGVRGRSGLQYIAERLPGDLYRSSYAGQIVVLTNPHIGNYGTTPHDADRRVLI